MQAGSFNNSKGIGQSMQSAFNKMKEKIKYLDLSLSKPFAYTRFYDDESSMPEKRPIKERVTYFLGEGAEGLIQTATKIKEILTLFFGAESLKTNKEKVTNFLWKGSEILGKQFNQARESATNIHTKFEEMGAKKGVKPDVEENIYEVPNGQLYIQLGKIPPPPQRPLPALPKSSRTFNVESPIYETID